MCGQLHHHRDANRVASARDSSRKNAAPSSSWQRGSIQMQTSDQAKPMQTNPPEPRWLVVVAMLAAGGLYFALPEPLSLGPSWLLLVIVSALLVPAVLTSHQRLPAVNVVVGHMLSGVITL